MRAIRFLVWAPFALATSVPIWLIIVFASAALLPQMFGLVFISVMIIGGLCIPIEQRLRPAPRMRQAALPKREKPKKITLAKLAVRLKGKAPTLNRIRRNLSPEIQKLLKQPVNRQPEAVLHDIKLLQGHDATLQ